MFSIMHFVQLLTQEWYLGHRNNRKILTDSEVLVIVYNSDERFSDISNDSVSCSDIELTT